MIQRIFSCLFFVILSIETIAQKNIFITPYVGGSNAFCKQLGGVYGFKANNKNTSVLNTIGVSLEIRKQNISKVILLETDMIGYGAWEQRQFPSSTSFFLNGFLNRRTAISMPVMRSAFLWKIPFLNQFIQKNDNTKFKAKLHFIVGSSLDYGYEPYEANSFEDFNVRDTLFTTTRFNVSLWSGLYIDFFIKKRNAFNLQIFYKQGIQQQFSVSRYDIMSKEVYQIISSKGSVLSILLGFPIRIKNF